MASDRIFVTEPVQGELKQLQLDTSRRAARLTDLLENDVWRESHKVEFAFLIDGSPVWVAEEMGATIAFIEDDDGSIAVIHLSF